MPAPEVTVFENEYYEVKVGDFAVGPEPCFAMVYGAKYIRGYKVYNKKTGVVESITPQYAEALGTAEGLAAAIDAEVWMWARAASRANLDMAREEIDDADPVH